MRMTRMQVCLLGLMLIALLVPAAYTQRGRGPGKGPPGGGPPGGGDWVDGFWAKVANGGSSLDIATYQPSERSLRGSTVEAVREKMMQFLQTKGVSNGKMNKEQFKEYMEQRFAEGAKEKSDRNFDTLSNNGASFNIKTVQIPQDMTGFESAETQKRKMEEFLKSKGINSGEMTKALYLQYREGRMKEFEDRRKGKDTRSQEEKDKETAERAKDYFGQIDTDKDNSLSKKEIEDYSQKTKGRGRQLLEDFAKYDKNNNGKIELIEYTEYIKDRSSRDRGNRDEDKKVEEAKREADNLELRPTVYRYGKLPKELPTTWSDDDKDKDGQIGLYEWKQQNKDVKQFLALDANGDGFLTPEEMLRYQTAQTKGRSTTVAVAAAGRPGDGGAVGGPRAEGRGGPRGGPGAGMGKFGGDPEKAKEMMRNMMKNRGGGKSGKSGKSGKGRLE